MAKLPLSAERSENIRVSTIVPVAPGEGQIAGLDGCLRTLPADYETIYVSSTPRPAGLDRSANWLVAPARSRAEALNVGADKALGKYLWFVHADTILPADAHLVLQREIDRNPCALIYFGLRFYGGGGIMRVNEIGAALRCALFKAPFGDQAICVARSLHQRIGGYNTIADYGEDHLYVRSARRLGAELARAAGEVLTSARKYRQRGWLNVVANHQFRWIRQAWHDRQTS